MTPQADITTEAKPRGFSSFLRTHRWWFIGGGILLFLPPLAVLFQLTQDANFCGTWCPRMFFSWREGTSLTQYLTGFLRSWMGVVLVAGILLSTLFLGRYWCSHACPIGGSMEAASRFIPKWMKIDFSFIPAPSVRYGYLSVYLIAPAIGLGSLCCNYCNFGAVPRMFGAAFIQGDMAYFLRTAGLINLGLVLFLGVLAKGGRGYCNMLCPIGALDALMNRAGLRKGRRVRVDGGQCVGCGKCVDVCPTWAIEMNADRDTAETAPQSVAQISQLSCMPCRQCEQVCPVEAISYEKQRQA